MSLKSWNQAKEEMRAALIECAKVGSIITQAELVKQVGVIRLDPFSCSFREMLVQICEEEDEQGRGLLGVVLAKSSTVQLMDEALLSLAIKRGRDPADKNMLNKELAKVHEYWMDQNKNVH